MSQRTKKRDTAGAKASITVARWIEPWGEARVPVDVDLLAKGCHTMYRRDDPITQVHGASWKGIDGFLQRNADNAKEWWITYSTNVGAERQRFTKAHELGHYILHSQQKGQFRCGPAVIVEKDTAEPNIEAQANQFASYLLMPANHVRPSIEKSPMTLDLISERASFYGVSFEAMCIRFVEITGERAVLVYWDSGILLRWSRSERAREQRLWLDARKGSPVEQFRGTLAADPLVRQCAEGQLVPANLWFRNAPDGEMLREMKHTSDTFERVLSLPIVPKFYPRWALDGEEGEDDNYDRFIGGGR